MQISAQSKRDAFFNKQSHVFVFGVFFCTCELPASTISIHSNQAGLEICYNLKKKIELIIPFSQIIIKQVQLFSIRFHSKYPLISTGLVDRFLIDRQRFDSFFVGWSDFFKAFLLDGTNSHETLRKIILQFEKNLMLGFTLLIKFQKHLLRILKIRIYIVSRYLILYLHKVVSKCKRLLR